MLHDYDIAPSQLASNAWRILGVFYLSCRIISAMWTSRLFQRLYYLKCREEFYFLQSMDKPIVTKLPKSNKGWKPLFIRMTDPTGFEIDLR